MPLSQNFSEQLTLADAVGSRLEGWGIFYGFPEDCLFNIISFTGPRDACILACVSKPFLSSALSDVVWEKFLPTDCQSLVPPSLSWSSKKELYFALCENQVLIEDGKKSFWLVKHSGKKCYMLAARDLGIAWGDNPNYWRWVSHPESRFQENAMLMLVYWFEIRGKINTQLLSPETKYSAFLVFKFSEDPHGFEKSHVEVGIKVGGKEIHTKNVWLDTEHDRDIARLIRPRHLGMPNWWSAPSYAIDYPNVEIEGPCPKERRDGWLEIGLGEFFNDGIANEDVEMSVMEVKGGNFKTGIIIQGIEVRPKDTN